MPAQSDVYLGNPNLKKANTQQNFTKAQVAEYIKCRDNPVYFTGKYLKIVNVDAGLIPFKMYDFQKDMMWKFHQNRFNIAKLPRQSGKSTIVTTYLLHYALFNENVNIAILANKAATAREMLSRLQLSYENLPRWMQQGIVAWNRGSLELENGSKIIALLLVPVLSVVCLLTLCFLTNLRLSPTIFAISFLVPFTRRLVAERNLK